MALTPRAEDPVFLREVDEELRRDQMESLALRHGRTIAIAIVLFLVVLGGILLWNAQRTAAKEKHAEELTLALTELGTGDKAKAAPALATLANDGSTGYRALALLTQADMAVEANDDRKAIAGYKSVADNDDFAQPVRDLARVRQAAIAFDTVPPAEIIAMLTPLAVPGTPWFGSAGEMVAVAYRNQGKTAEATKLFAQLARDKDIPDTIRTRASQMAGALGVDVTQDAGAGAQPGMTVGDGK